MTSRGTNPNLRSNGTATGLGVRHDSETAAVRAHPERRPESEAEESSRPTPLPWNAGVHREPGDAQGGQRVARGASGVPAAGSLAVDLDAPRGDGHVAADTPRPSTATYVVPMWCRNWFWPA